MKRRIRHRCGAAKVGGGVCGQPVAAAGQRCRDHPHGKTQPKALRKASEQSWNAQSPRQAPASRTGKQQEGRRLRDFLLGRLVAKWASPKMIKAKGRIMAPVDAVAREVPYGRSNGKGGTKGRPRVKTPHSRVWRRQISREQ